MCVRVRINARLVSYRCAEMKFTLSSARVSYKQTRLITRIIYTIETDFELYPYQN